MKATYFSIVLAALVLIASPVMAQVEPVSNTDSPSGAAGDLSVQLKGVSSLGATDTEGVLNIIEGPITMEAWIKLDDYTEFWTGMGQWGFSYKMGISADGQFIFTFFGIADIFSGFDITPFVGDGMWHHYACAWEPGVGVYFFVDGEEVALIEQTGSPREGEDPANITIGGENNGAVPLTGSIDRFRIHNALLTAEEIDSDAANPAGPLDSTIVHYGFDEGAAPYSSLGSASLDVVAQNEVSSAPNWEIFQ